MPVLSGFGAHVQQLVHFLQSYILYIVVRTRKLTEPMRALLEAATRLAVRLDHPAYDCVYLALAEAEGCPFVTADDRLLRKIGQHPPGRFSGRVLSLTDAAAAITG